MKDFAATSAAYLHDDLPPAERAAFEAALAADPRLRADHTHLAAMHNHLTDHLAAARPSGDFESRLVRNFRQHRAESTPARGFSTRLAAWLRLPAIYIPATAAVLVALVQTGALLTGERDSQLHTATNSRVGKDREIDTRGWASLADEAAPSAPVVTAGEARRPGASGESPTSSTGIDGVSSPSTLLAGAQTALREQAGGSTRRKEVPAQADPESRNETSKLPVGASLPSEPSAGSPAPPVGAVDARKLIRNADVDLEVAAFAPAAQGLIDLARQSGGYLETRDSTRLPNGKTRGVLVVKIPPAALDGFVSSLRSLGEVRHQSLGTQDVTKDYFDSDARLRNARKMEERLLELLRTTKGKVSELLAVERELARVRGQIEELQGQLKLWDSLVAYATVTIRLAEKDLEQAAKYLLREQATVALASVDVPRTYEEARTAADKAGAQILESSLSVDGQQRASALLRVLLAPDRADAFLAQIRTLGRPLDFRRETERVARDGHADSPDARTERDRVQVTVTIASQDETPAQRTQLRIETDTVEAKTRDLRTYAAQHGIEIKDSAFEQSPDGRQTARLRLAFPLANYPETLARVQSAGTTRDLSVQRNDTGQPGAVSDRAEISVVLATPPKLVAADSGMLATLRHTFTQAFGAVMWSLRMIGVSLAFLLPWAVAAGILFALVRVLLRRRNR